MPILLNKEAYIKIINLQVICIEIKALGYDEHEERKKIFLGFPLGI